MQTPAKPGIRIEKSSGLADALFSSTQQRVLALLFGQPDRSFYATELIQMAGSGSGAVQRELAKLKQSGLVTVQLVGRQKHYQANAASPLFRELASIVRKTVGLAEPLRQALRPLARDIAAAFVYGSVAKKRDTARSDIDLMIISDSLTYSDVYSALEPLRARLKREVNPTVYSRLEIAKRLKEGNAFLSQVLEQPKLWVIGTDRDLTAYHPEYTVQAMTVTERIEIDSDDLLEVCRRFQVAGLFLFGSALREDFRPDSDVDLLVEFKPEARIGLLALSRLRRELERIFGRPVDLVPRDGVKDEVRKAIQDRARVLYAA